MESLEALVQLRAPRVFVIRTGLSPDSWPRIIVQRSIPSANGAGPLPPGLREQVVDYPNNVAPWAKFEHALQEQYRIVLRIEDDRDVWAAGKKASHSLASSLNGWPIPRG
jgi:hypothetical protein